MSVDAIFSDPFSSVFLLINLVLAGVSFWWWKKYRHPDYLWLSALWGILLVLKFAVFTSYALLMPAPDDVSYLDALLTFSIIRGTITWTAIFYIFLIMFKWIVDWTPQRAKVVSWLMSIEGIVSVTIFMVITNTLLSSYLTALWLQ